MKVVSLRACDASGRAWATRTLHIHQTSCSVVIIIALRCIRYYSTFCNDSNCEAMLTNA